MTIHHAGCLPLFIRGALAMLLAPAALGAKYELRLPLQYDRYLSWSARSLGMGGTEAAGQEPLSIFGQPDRTCRPGSWGAAVTSTWLTPGRSHVFTESEKTQSLPSATAGSLRLRGHWLTLGWRRALDDRISFPDIYNPLLKDRAATTLDQVALGWAYSTSGNASLGMALVCTRADFEWQGPAEPYAIGKASGCGFSGGLTIPVTAEIKLGLYTATKTVLKGTTDFLPDPSATGDLKLSGAAPGRTKVEVAYRLDPGLFLAAGAAITGWNGVTQGYEARLDLHLGGEVQITDFLWLRMGAFTKNSPLDEYERKLDPSLQDLYLLTAGLGISWRCFYIDLGGAGSRPLSGAGQSQNIVAATAGLRL